MKKLLKRMFITLLSIIGLLILIYFLFVNFYPSFGGDVSKIRQEKYTTSTQFKNGIFKTKPLWTRSP